MQPVLEVENLVKHFGPHRALDGVSFSVPPGVVFAILGENGAGKTTLIRILLGLLQADAGSARVLDCESATDGLAIRKSIGYVSERPSLDEWMSVDEVGWYAAGFYAAGFHERFRAKIAEFGVDRNRKVKQLSKGMRSKVALSLALAHDPQLLILDEPTSGLDTLVRREFLESMVDFTSNGKTVILSSHQIHEVERVADIVAILRTGELLVCEPLDQLKRTVTEATITLASESAVIEWPPGAIYFERRGRQGQLFLRTELLDAETMLSGLPLVENFEVKRPTLEEIFVAFMKSDSVRPAVNPISEGAKS